MAKRTPFAASVRLRPRLDGTVAGDVRYRIDGRARTTTFESPEKAERWKKIVQQIGPVEALKLLQTYADDIPTVDEFAERYINQKSGVEGLTTDHYKMFMRLHISPVMGSLPLDAVTHELVAKWIKNQDAAGAAAKTITNRHGFLAGMFQYAVDVAEILPKNPCAHSKLPSGEREEMVFLSADEFAELLSFVPARWRPLVFLLASTGMRWGEATALKPGDFDFSHGTVIISRAWKKSKAKGWYIGPPKTAMSKRTIKVPADALDAVQPLVREADIWVFTNASGRPVRQQHFHGIVWTPATRLANGKPAFDATRGKGDTWVARKGGVWDREPSSSPINKRPRVHDLRHSHASWLINRGVNLVAIQRRLGHESVKTTSDRYGHLSPDMLSVPADVVGEVLAGAMPQIEP